MADIPRDPRQLARDILAGKISIEELAREQARRAGGGLRVPPAQPRVPDRIPLPRPVQAPPQRPVVRQPPPVVNRPRPVIKTPTVRRAEPVPVPRSPLVVTPQAPEAPEAPRGPVLPGEPPRPVQAAGGQLGIAKVMKNKMALRQCMVMAEVLGKPVALREEW